MQSAGYLTSQKANQKASSIVAKNLKPPSANASPTRSFQRTLGNQIWQSRYSPTSPSPRVHSPNSKVGQTTSLPSQHRHPGFSGAANTPPQLINFQGLDEGQPLPQAIRSEHERQFGRGFSQVRVHTSEQATTLADGLSADAFVFGNHIVFNQGTYQPNNQRGKQLLTHELGHTVEQAPGGALGHPRIQRQQRVTQWAPIADAFLQGLQITPQFRNLVISALREEHRVNSTQPRDFQFILSGGVLVRPAASNTRSLARYHSANRSIEVGLGNQIPDAALITSLANAFFHAFIDLSNDRTLPGTIRALPPQGQRRVLRERTEREQIITDMFRDMSPQPASGASRFQLQRGGRTITRINLREQVLIALRAFSLGQLHQLKDAGIRFWRINQGIPPNYDVSPCTQPGTTRACVQIPRTDRNFRRLPRSMRGNIDIEINPGGGGIAAYQPHFRLVFLKRPDTTIHSGHIRHELGHAFDDIRNNRGAAQRLDSLNTRARQTLIRQLAVDQVRDNRLTALTRSHASPRHIRQELGTPSHPIFYSAQNSSRISHMYARYLRGLPTRNQAFDGTARQGHSQRNPQEFYAEGFNVFHGRNKDAQARLLTYAPELYNLLEQEGQAAGRPLPSQTQLQAYIQRNRREFPPRRP